MDTSSFMRDIELRFDDFKLNYNNFEFFRTQNFDQKSEEASLCPDVSEQT